MHDQQYKWPHMVTIGFLATSRHILHSKIDEAVLSVDGVELALKLVVGSLGSYFYSSGISVKALGGGLVEIFSVFGKFYFIALRLTTSV